MRLSLQLCVCVCVFSRPHSWEKIDAASTSRLLAPGCYCLSMAGWGGGGGCTGVFGAVDRWRERMTEKQREGWGNKIRGRVEGRECGEEMEYAQAG